MESREGQAIRLGSLDTLRGIAILAVMATHAAIAFPGRLGDSALFMATVNQGVQLFFLVSAFTMCTMWRARAAEPHRTINFYIRRVCRIAPLYWVAILGYGLLRGWPPLIDILANVAFVHSLVPSAINSGVPGGWSIGVELAFYLLFPLAARLPSALLLPAALAWYVGMGLAGEAALAGAGVDGTFLYYSPLTQMPIFLIGMYAYDWLHRRSPGMMLAGVATIVLWVAVALVARKAGWPARLFFWAGIGGMAAAVAVVVRYDLALAPLRWLGQVSYSAYLIHVAVLEAVVAVLPPTLNPLVALVPLVAITAALAYLSYRTGERWSQDLAKKLVRRRPGAERARPLPA